ncbi:hypothetical protein ACSTI9_00880, partial [Vibrio parahaemolyticus]
RTWPALTVIALLVITSLTFSTILMTSTKEFRLAKVNAAVEAAKEIAATNSTGRNIIAKNYFTNVEPHKITAATISQIEESNFDSEALSQNNATAEAAVIVQQQT